MGESTGREDGWGVVWGEFVDARVLVGQDVGEHLEGCIEDGDFGELTGARELTRVGTPHADLFFGTGLGLAACANASK